MYHHHRFLLQIVCPTCYASDVEALNWKRLEHNQDVKHRDIKALKFRCPNCGRTMRLEDLKGQCLTCKHNAGSCLPGGTGNPCIGAHCMNTEFALKLLDYDNIEEMTQDYPAFEDPSKFYGAIVYRTELILTEECEGYEQSVETFKKYLGTGMRIRGETE